jgi:hypothetical protein
MTSSISCVTTTASHTYTRIIYTAIAPYTVVYIYIHTKPKAYPLRIYIPTIYKTFIKLYIKIEKISLFKATGQERLILRTSSPGFTLWTQDIFQYEAPHLLQSVSQQYSKKNSVAVRGPSRLQNTPMQYRGPTSLQEELPCSSRPFPHARNVPIQQQQTPATILG